MKTLIVGDDEVSRKLLQRYLSEHGELVIAQNGVEAIETFEHAIKADQRFDLICLDYIMPGINGIKTLETIRHIEREYQIRRTKRVKIIMVTVVSKESEIQKAFFCGCDAYIIRPDRKERLLDEIRSFGLISKTTKQQSQKVRM